MRSVVIVGTAALLTGLMPTSAHAAPVTITPSPTGLETVHAVSYTGRYAVGATKTYGRLRLIDTTTGRLIHLLPSRSTSTAVAPSRSTTAVRTARSPPPAGPTAPC